MPAAIPLPAHPIPKAKTPFPNLTKECYGTFREDFSETKKEECHTCNQYVDCIQISFKQRHQFKREIRRFTELLQARIEALQEPEGGRSPSRRLPPIPGGPRRSAAA